MRAPKGYPPQFGVCMGSGTISQVYLVYKWQNTHQTSQINKEEQGDYWFMRQHDVKLPSGMTESRGSNNVKKYLSVSFLFHLSLFPSFSSAFLCFRFTFRQALCTCWQRWPTAIPSSLCLCNCHPGRKGNPLSQQVQWKSQGWVSLASLEWHVYLETNHDGQEDGIHLLARLTHG